ncbi:hypothetical protein BM1_03240 [Bipolaris maydis]|nr:hypothetical protein BM1_03240 [Bipolaris maydis]
MREHASNLIKRGKCSFKVHASRTMCSHMVIMSSASQAGGKGPQINSVTSTLQRITGLTLSGCLYLFGIAYLVAPYTGWHVDTTSIVAAVAAWPTAIKMGVKAFLAFKFFFHGFNGLRHLTWDVGIGFKNQNVIRTGWTVIGMTVVVSLYCTFMA